MRTIFALIAVFAVNASETTDGARTAVLAVSVMTCAIAETDARIVQRCAKAVLKNVLTVHTTIYAAHAIRV